ncbi:MAG: rhomboid family intramembrane serine protease [Pseudomonadota bacterium]
MIDVGRHARSVAPLIAFVASLWAAHVFNIALQGALTERFGLIPRRIDGLDGILAMPFLHGDWAHLSANTPPLLVLGGLIILLAPDRFWTATLLGVLLGGALTWLFARHNNHIGASGLIFAWFGFLVALGVLERSARALIGAGVAVFFYGAPTLLGLAPEDSRISWDGHLAGLAAGVVAAWALHRPPRRAPEPWDAN